MARGRKPTPHHPSARPVGAILLLLVVAALASPAAATSRQLDAPQTSELAAWGGVPESTLTTTRARRLALSPSHWGGRLTAATGEPVTILFSDGYPQDPALAQRWADFLASLVHGPELASVTVYLSPLAEVQSVCGRLALACYSARDGAIVAPGDDPRPEFSAEAILAHEYGHHVAASRSNAPWRAIDYGTKRWASYQQVCAQARDGLLFPGNESDRYELNPGEAFAESYRVLNQRRAGVAEAPWEIVSTALYPDDTALALLEQDVTAPWSANTQVRYAGSLTRAARTRTYRVATPFDGTLRVTLRGSAKARVALEILDGGGARVGRAVATGTPARSASTTVCGSRSFRVRLSLTGPSARFSLTVSKP